jgi:hypothetical protein
LPPRGTAQIVYSPEGVPLILPITAGLQDLRRAVGSEGHYRLAPIDEHRRRIPDARRGYVVLTARSFVETQGRGATWPPTAQLLALARVSIEQAEALMALATALLDTARTLLRTTEDTGNAVQAIRDLMK